MTIKEIAARCGVSRATVDRVINGRGKVRPETQERILALLAESGYTKNIAGRALTVRRTAPVIGVALSSEGNPFFDEVIAGIRQAEAELSDYGVTIRLGTMRGYHTDAQLALIDGVSSGISALVLHPINDAAIAQKVDALYDAGIPTVTLNSDLSESRRSCYVGSDYTKGGETAAGLVRLATQGTAKLGILSGVDTILGHGQRLSGFLSHLKRNVTDIEIVRVESAQDDDKHAYWATHTMLAEHPEIDTLMVIAAGIEGVCGAVMDLGHASRMRVFAFDVIPSTVDMMRLGLVRAAISQQPFQQGYQAVRAAFDILLTGDTEAEDRIMIHQIKILENLSE